MAVAWSHRPEGLVFSQALDVQMRWPDDSALADLLFRLWHEPARCWLKWSGQPG